MDSAVVKPSELKVRYAYYLDMAIAHINRDSIYVELLKKHGYENPADVLTQLKESLP